MRDRGERETTLTVMVPNLKIAAVQVQQTLRGDAAAIWNPGGWAGAIASFLTLILGDGTAHLAAWIVVLMLFDLASGLLRARILPEQEVCWPKFAGGMLGKLLLLMLIPAAKGADVALRAAGVALEWGDLTVVTFTMAGLMMHESGSIWRNVTLVKGRLTAGAAIARAISLFGARAQGLEEPPARRLEDKVAEKAPPIVLTEAEQRELRRIEEEEDRA